MTWRDPTRHAIRGGGSLRMLFDKPVNKVENLVGWLGVSYYLR